MRPGELGMSRTLTNLLKHAMSMYHNAEHIKVILKLYVIYMTENVNAGILYADNMYYCGRMALNS